MAVRGLAVGYPAAPPGKRGNKTNTVQQVQYLRIGESGWKKMPSEKPAEKGLHERAASRKKSTAFRCAYHSWDY